MSTLKKVLNQSNKFNGFLVVAIIVTLAAVGVYIVLEANAATKAKTVSVGKPYSMLWDGFAQKKAKICVNFTDTTSPSDRKAVSGSFAFDFRTYKSDNTVYRRTVVESLAGRFRPSRENLNPGNLTSPVCKTLAIDPEEGVASVKITARAGSLKINKIEVADVK